MQDNPVASQILASLPNPVFILDAENQFQFLNHAAEMFFQSSQSIVFAQELQSFIASDSPLFSMLSRARNQNRSVADQGLELAGPRVGYKLVNVQISPFEANGSLLVTMQERALAERLRGQSLFRGAARSVTSMAAMLAHEVKNPLSGIKGSAQILMNKLNDDFSKKFLDIIINETERLNNIVTKILTPPKKPKLELFNIHSALEKVFALSQADEYKDLKIQRDYDPSIPEVYGDEDLFIQAILNIFKNAQQALTLTENPLITIKSRVTYSQPINGVIHSTLCEVSIIDNGPGIPQDIQEQIFFPMVSSKESGSGLGLSISQDIIRIHGGAISFKSESNGTTFSILVPINIESLSEEAKSA